MRVKVPEYIGGGPLFPITYPERDGYTEISTSATMADFFAAHAPAEPPDWFELEAAEPKPRVLDAEECLAQQPGWNGLHPCDRTLLRDWLKDGTYDLQERFTSIGEPAAALFSGSRLKAKAWQDAYTVERYFAWRWYFAHQMLTHRPRG